MELVLTDIWAHLKDTIDFTIVCIVIASGYLLARGRVGFAFFGRISQTLRVILISLPLTLAYGLSRDVDFGTMVASYFISFGFHSVVLKFIDKLVKNLV